MPVRLLIAAILAAMIGCGESKNGPASTAKSDDSAQERDLANQLILIVRVGAASQELDFWRDKGIDDQLIVGLKKEAEDLKAQMEKEDRAIPRRYGSDLKGLEKLNPNKVEAYHDMKRAAESALETRLPKALEQLRAELSALKDKIAVDVPFQPPVRPTKFATDREEEEWDRLRDANTELVKAKMRFERQLRYNKASTPIEKKWVEKSRKDNKQLLADLEKKFFSSSR
jgi:hypothetical protein